MPQQKKGTIKEYKKLLYKKQYTHLKVLQLRYSGRDSIIQVRIDLIFIMVPLGEQKKEEVAQTYKTSCRYVTYSRFGKLCLIVKEYIVILFLKVIKKGFFNVVLECVYTFT